MSHDNSSSEKKDFTPYYHALLSLLVTSMMAGLGWLLHSKGICLRNVSGSDVECAASLAHGAIAGACFSIGFYLGREVAQAEYRGDYPDNVEYKWYRGFYFTHWNKPSQRDLIYPVVASIVLATILQFV